MPESPVFYTRTLSIVGDVLRIALPKDADEGPSFGDLAEVRDEQRRPRIAQVDERHVAATVELHRLLDRQRLHFALGGIDHGAEAGGDFLRHRCSPCRRP